MSDGRGGLRINLSLSKMHMSSPDTFRAREEKREMADHLPRALWAANFLAAYVFSRLFCRDLYRRIHGRSHGHEGTALVTGLERDSAVAKGKEGMVLAHAHAFARIELGTALAHDHIAARHGFAAEQLDAQHLGIGIAPVARGTAGFLMRHDLLLASRDTEHLHRGEVLAVAALAMGVLAALLLESDDLVALPCSTISHWTDAPATSGAPIFGASPPSIRTSRSSLEPTSPDRLSTFRTLSLATLYCFPPVRTTAYMV